MIPSGSTTYACRTVYCTARTAEQIAHLLRTFRIRPQQIIGIVKVECLYENSSCLSAFVSICQRQYLRSSSPWGGTNCKCEGIPEHSLSEFGRVHWAEHSTNAMHSIIPEPSFSGNIRFGRPVVHCRTIQFFANVLITLGFTNCTTPSLSRSCKLNHI